jgi:hypothetical protein
MNLTPVSSSTIAAIGHDNDKMQVEFKSGNIYEYSGISKNLYDSIINAESVGKRFASLKTTGALNNFVQL